jgi:hypothetical protein
VPRLGVMDEHEVPLVLQRDRVALVVPQIRLALAPTELDRHALEPVVNPLRDLEEVSVPRDHPPLGLQPDVALERHELTQQFGHTAARCGRADLEYAQPSDVAGEVADLRHRVVSDHLPVALDGLSFQLDAARAARGLRLRGGPPCRGRSRRL